MREVGLSQFPLLICSRAVYYKFFIAVLFCTCVCVCAFSRFYFVVLFILRWGHTIRKCIFQSESLEISYIWGESIYSFGRGIRFSGQNCSIPAFRGRKSRVSISYRRISYRMSPPYYFFQLFRQTNSI